MASLNNIIEVAVTTQNINLRQQGFGVPLIVGYHTRFPERYRIYTDLAGMAADGFTTGDGEYRMAAALLAQNPTVSKFVIGRRTTAPDLELQFTPTAQNSTAYKVTVTDRLGASGTASFTSDSSATVAEITAGLSAAITGLGLTDIVASDQTTHVRIKATSAGQDFFAVAEKTALLSSKEMQVDAGIASDLDAIQLANDDFYGVLSVTNGSNGTATTSEAGALSAWVESHGKIAFIGSSDGDLHTGSTTDIGSLLKAASRMRTFVIYGADPIEEVAAAFAGAILPYEPGSITGAFRQLAGVTRAPLTPSQIANLDNKNVNYFVDYSGIGMTGQGKVSGGEWLDVIRDRDWFESRLRTLAAAVFAGSLKVPFTDAGISLFEAVLRKVVREAVIAGFIAEGSDVYTIPLAADVAPVDRAARRLKTLKVSARLAGAIHFVRFEATITP